MTSTRKHSIASKARWAKKSPEERSKRMSEVASAKWANVSPELIKAHMKMMAKAKILKANKIQE